uniref:Uncharacterized protein n=1 Tax=Populus trichocarpa TaxID=3694 RepID=A0A2K2BK46_POPTR
MAVMNAIKGIKSIFLTLATTVGSNIGKVLQNKGTVILPPLSFKLKA